MSRPAGASVPGARAGRRERARITHERSFTERYRSAIVGVAAIAGVAIIAIFVFASASASAYACTKEWSPEPTTSPAAGATQALGYVQPDMGKTHVGVGTKVTYTYCPPASSAHINQSAAGPIQPRLYGPDDSTIPEGWVHNLEHGAMVIVYRGRDGDPGITSAGQAALKSLFDSFPVSPVCGIAPGTIQGPVITRFDQMATPYAAIVWDRVLPLDTLDTAQIVTFWQQWGERTNPEPACSPPSAAPSEAPSAAPIASPTPAPSAAPSAAPSTGSGAPSPS
ncbi:MAG: DUF3105 domain-containing protein [Chloroflexi bacterium]|nr:DUF3105 domain-containing protein [Chloroflexota bacterium]